jgi:hypothetical protein
MTAMPSSSKPQGSAGIGSDRPAERGDRPERGDRTDRAEWAEFARNPAAEAERLAREHTNKREQRTRQERGRPWDEGRSPPTMRTPPERPSVAPGSAVARPLSSTTTRLGPVDDQTMPVLAHHDDSLRTVAQMPLFDGTREAPVSGGRESASPAAALIDDVAIEAEELLRETSSVWGRWSIADRISASAAFLTLGGTLLPWLWRKNADVVLGIGSGGIVHAVVAVAALYLLFRRETVLVDERGVRLTPARKEQRGRRTALWMLLLALVSTVAGTWLLLVWGAVRRYEVPDLEIGIGLYLTLAAGLGLSYSGFSFFWRREGPLK